MRPEVARSADTELLMRVLDGAAARLDAGEVRDPRTEAELREVVGSTLYQLGELVEARRHYERSLELLRASGDEGEAIEAPALCGLARVHEREGDLQGAEAISRAALALPGLSLAQRVELHTTLAVVHARTERHDEALRCAERALEDGRALHPGDAAAALVQQNLLAFVALQAGRLAEAEALAREVLATADREGLGRDTGVRLTALRTLYEVERQDGRLADALATALQCQELERPVYGERALWTRLSRSAVLDLLKRLGRGDEALALALARLEAESEEGRPPELELFAEAIGLIGSGLGPPGTIQRVIRELEASLDRGGGDPGEAYAAELLLARARLVAGQRADALALLERLVPEGRATLGPAHAEVLHATNTLAVERMAEGRSEEALALLEPALHACALLDEEPLICTVCRHSLAEALLAAGRVELAVEELERVLEDYGEGEPGYAGLAFAQLRESLLRLGRTERAAAVYARRIGRHTELASSAEAAPAVLLELAEALLAAPHPELREPGLALEFAERAVERAPASDARAEITRARCLAATGQPGLALERLEQALRGLPTDSPPEAFEALERAIDALVR